MMSKQEGSKTVVLGGRNGVPQQYCGTVGVQSTNYSTMDTEIEVCLVFCSFGMLITHLHSPGISRITV